MCRMATGNDDEEKQLLCDKTTESLKLAKVEVHYIAMRRANDSTATSVRQRSAVVDLVRLLYRPSFDILHSDL